MTIDVFNDDPEEQLTQFGLTVRRVSRLMTELTATIVKHLDPDFERHCASGLDWRNWQLQAIRKVKEDDQNGAK